MKKLINYLNPGKRRPLENPEQFTAIPIGLSSAFEEYNMLGVQQPKYPITAEQMKRLADKSVWVSICIRAITNVIGQLRFQIVPEDNYIEEFEESLELQMMRYYILQLFTLQNGTFRSLMQNLKSAAADILKIDAGTIEIVRVESDPVFLTKDSGRRGRMCGLITRDASTILVDHDEKQIIRRYVQTGTRGRQSMPYAEADNQIFGPDFGGDFAVFDIHDMIFMTLHPQSGSVYGTPPIAILLDTLNADLAADRNLARFMATGGVVPGFVALDDSLGADLTKRYEAAFSRMQRNGVRSIPLISGAGNARFVAISPNSREMELSQLQSYMMKKILGIYQVPPHIVGITDGVNRGLAFAQTDSFMSGAVMPLVNLFQETLTQLLHREFTHKLRFEFLEPMPLDFETRMKQMDMLKQSGMIGRSHQFTYVGQKAPKEETPATIMENLQMETARVQLETQKVALATAMQQNLMTAQQMSNPQMAQTPGGGSPQFQQGMAGHQFHHKDHSGGGQQAGPSPIDAMQPDQGQPAPAPDESGAEFEKTLKTMTSGISPSFEPLGDVLGYLDKLYPNLGFGANKKVLGMDLPGSDMKAGGSGINFKPGDIKPIKNPGEDQSYNEDPMRRQDVQERQDKVGGPNTALKRQKRENYNSDGEYSPGR